MIVVTGATGSVGGAAVRELSAGGAAFRALVRDPNRAREVLDPGVPLVQGDLDDPASLDAALDGATTVLLVSPTGPSTIRHSRALVDGAGRVGVTHVVKLSALGTEPDSPLHLARWHAEAEDVIRMSGIAHTFLRPGSFMQNFLMDAPTIREKGEFYSARGDGKRAIIDVRDIGAVAAAVLTDPGRSEDAALHLTGSEAVSDGDCAEALSRATGRTVRHVSVSLDAAAAGMHAAGLPDWLVDDLLILDELTAKGLLNAATPVVRDILGRDPLTYADFARDYATAFTP